MCQFELNFYVSNDVSIFVLYTHNFLLSKITSKNGRVDNKSQASPTELRKKTHKIAHNTVYKLVKTFLVFCFKNTNDYHSKTWNGLVCVKSSQNWHIVLWFMRDNGFYIITPSSCSRPTRVLIHLVYFRIIFSLHYLWYLWD